MGYIYAMIVDGYDGVYIGQTIGTVKSRVNEHINEANRGISNSKINKAIRSAGKDGIEYVELEECTNSLLNSRETFYIKAFNSVENGLNTRYEGSVSHHERAYIINIIKDFKSGKSMLWLAKKYNLTYSHISKIMTSIGVHRDKVEKAKSNKAKAVFMYNTEFKMEAKFKTIKDAIAWLNDNGNNVSIYNGYTRIKQSCYIGNIAYGHRWQFVDELLYEDKEFNTIFDIEAYKKCGVIEVNEYGRFESANEVVGKARKVQIKVTECQLCGKRIATGCKHCIDCYKELNAKGRNTYKNRQVPLDMKLVHPLSEEDLRKLYPKYTLNSIANACGVSYTTLDKLAKKYGLK